MEIQQFHSFYKHKCLFWANKSQHIMTVGMSDDKRKKVIVALGVFAGIALFAIVYHFFTTKPTTDRVLQLTALTVNKKCPMMVDGETRLDSVQAIGNKTLQYHYTLVNYSVEELDREKLRTTMQVHILNEIKTKPEMKVFREKGVQLVYFYKDKVADSVLLLVYKPEDYL